MIISRILFAVTAIPFVLASKGGGSGCSSSQFQWDAKDCCLPYGGPSQPESPPKGSQCPSNWSWNSDKGCCAPHQPPQNLPPPQCDNGWGWSDASYCCSAPSQPTTPGNNNPSAVPNGGGNGNRYKRSRPISRSSQCSTSEFKWDAKDCCLPYGGPSPTESPPKGSECPSNWSWKSDKGCCAPHQPPQNLPPPQCDNGWVWSDATYCCSAPGQPTTPGNNNPSSIPNGGGNGNRYRRSRPIGRSSQCSSSEFRWDAKSCCLPYGGPSPTESPPKGSECPSNWSWKSDKGCCAPHQPPQSLPPPQCDNGWVWSETTYCCSAPSQPTTPGNNHPSAIPNGGDNGGNGGYHKRTANQKRQDRPRSISLCPQGLDACPVSSLTGGDFDCVDTASDLDNCGGCTIFGDGQNCNAITGSWNVGCEKGACKVYTCAQGYKLATDQKSCIPL